MFLQPACKIVESLAISSHKPELRLRQKPAGILHPTSPPPVCQQILSILPSKSLLSVSVPSHPTEGTPVDPVKWGPVQGIEAGHWEASCKECVFA